MMGLNEKALKEMIRLNLDSGSLYFKSVRVWLTRPEMIAFIHKWIRRIAGEALLEAIYEAGKECGRKDFTILEEIMGTPRDVKEMMKDVSPFYTIMGWGKMSVEKVEEGEVTFYVENSPIAENLKGSEEPVCMYLSGYGAGLLSQATGEEWNGVEVECAATGKYPRCKFLLSRKNRKDLILEVYGT